jgi:NADPH-dependent 2,4-dienoyl-CoA reductase/sulfur reductase-like enzyme
LRDGFVPQDRMALVSPAEGSRNMKNVGAVIIGASLAGLRTAEALRARSYGECITLVGVEPGLPYDRPPLSKDSLSSDHSGEVPLLRDDVAFAELELELRAETRATRLDPDRRRVCLSTGDEVPYDDVVIATGADARRLPRSEGVDGFRTLRTLADADLLRADFDRRPKVVVLGGGFIGAEVAAAARARDLDVDLVELLPAPMSGALGPTVGALLADLHTDHGVRLHCGVTVARVFGTPRVEKVELSNGTVLDADVVVMGLGVIPATGWLLDSGLEVDNGVKCDDRLQASGRPCVYAVGDVARWTHPIFDESIRVEHWTNANEHADVVASAIMGEPRVAGAVPYVWSDQYHRKIQIVGRPAAGDDITLIEDPADGRHVAVYERRGRVVGMLTVDAPRTMLRGRRAIAAGTSAAELVASL